MGKNILKAIAPIAGAILGSTILPGVGLGIGSLAGGAVGSGAGTLAAGGGVKNALLSAGGSYLGGSLVGAGNVGPAGTIGSSLGSIGLDSAANALPAELAGSSLGSSLGAAAGSNLAVGAFGDPAKVKTPSAPGMPGFTASQQGQMSLPPSLSQLSGLNPEQQSSNIATQGVYGGGEGAGENQYFLNLINRKLVDEQGNVGDPSTLAPINQSYLSQLGLGGYSNGTDLLKKISQYKAA